MKHYDYVEWLLYKNNTLSDEKQKEMEEHLYNCDICMEIFLSLIDENDTKTADILIPEDFTDNVISKINNTKIKKFEPKKNKKSFNYQFGYYVAVASVTIFLTLGGFYTNLVDAVPKISKSVEALEKVERTNIIADFSKKIVNSTSSILTSIENIERNKEEK